MAREEGGGASTTRQEGGTRPRRSPARRCPRPLGKSPAAGDDALAREPPTSIPPAARLAGAAPSSGFGQNPTTYTRGACPSAKGMPDLTLGAGATPLGGSWGCRETPRRAPPPPPPPPPRET
ncbi:unnamed protein product [Pipistrellus nathusii]|uniref:Uncharacterized protein n=1 Tax=Pipistrellus nathusii TaxID=59473 RepID=A0ABN9Z8B3_PIPNA